MSVSPHRSDPQGQHVSEGNRSRGEGDKRTVLKAHGQGQGWRHGEEFQRGPQQEIPEPISSLLTARISARVTTPSTSSCPMS
jgi:hypothetical protein